MDYSKAIMNKKLHIALLALIIALGTNSLALAQNTPAPETVAAATDTTYPSDVENVKAVASDKTISLSWDAATDNVDVKGYKIFYGTQSVASDTASYTLGPIDAGNVLTYEIKNLINDQPYYFALTAYDAATNESEFYSTEVSATPKVTGAAPAADDKTAPKVVSATAPFITTVKVVFSEALMLPANKPETAFSIKDDFLGTALSVTKAEMDATDKSNKTVVLTTADQKKNSKYILTAGIQIQDLAGNPIVSGTSDTAVFTGTDVIDNSALKPAPETPAPAGDVAPPSFIAVQALDGNTVQVTFSEPVVLLTNAAENFIITDATDNTKITNVNKVAISQNGTVATLTTDDLKLQKFNLIALKVKDAAGNLMDVQNSATTFDGLAPTAPVVLPTTKIADAATDLVAKMVSSMMVNLSWKTKADQMANVANFVVYLSTDRGATYGPGVMLNGDATSYDFNNLKEDMIYYFKLTTKDAAGNESEGIITYLTLPKTGPELALLLFGSGGLGALFTRKKKKINYVR